MGAQGEDCFIPPDAASRRSAQCQPRCTEIAADPFEAQPDNVELTLFDTVKQLDALTRHMTLQQRGQELRNPPPPHLAPCCAPTPPRPIAGPSSIDPFVSVERAGST